MPMPAHMEVTGTQQGKLAGGCEMRGREGTILVEAFNHEVRIPRDPQTGLRTGKRVHNALSIVKVFDKSSPLLYKALCSGEVLTDVTVKWYRIAAAGQEEHYFTHQLKNAIVVSIRPWMPNCLDPKTESYTHMEEVSFTYEKIVWTYVDGGVTHEDDWQVPYGS